MTYADDILSHLRKTGTSLCDDCLAEVVPLKHRQQAHSRCNRLLDAGRVRRDSAWTCDRCGKIKFCTRALPTSVPTAPSALVGTQAPSVGKPDRLLHPWHWEGNVQRVLVGWLQGGGWTIVQHADTASKQPGQDIIARRAADELWVSVKGYPRGTAKTNASTQARHWFSHGVFDLVRYRTQAPCVQLALGLPDVGKTYRGLRERSRWAFDTLPARILWVSEHGSVRPE